MSGVEIILLVCSIIAAIGGAFVAIKNIVEISGKPVKFAQNRQEQRVQQKINEGIQTFIQEELPKILYDHDIKTRDKYRSDRENYLQEIKKEVLRSIQEKLSEIDEVHCGQDKITKILDSVVIGMRNVLREKINLIFNRNKKDQTLTYHEKEELETYFRDYKAMGGNSYIDDRMAIMRSWQVIDE